MSGYSRAKIGNWVEDAANREAAYKEFVRRKEAGELSMHQLQSTLQSATAQTPSTSEDGLVVLGDRLALRHVPTNSLLSSLPPMGPLVDETVEATAAPEARYSARNVLRVRSARAGGPTGPLCYGDAVHLVAELPEGDLYLASEKPSPLGGNGVSQRSGLQRVYFARGNPGYAGAWQAVSYDPQLRPEFEGRPVEANTLVLLRHCSSGQLLAALEATLVRSEFGVELEVVAQTKLDSHRAEAPQNLWALEMGVPEADPPQPEPGAAEGAGGDGGAVGEE